MKYLISIYMYVVATIFVIFILLLQIIIRPFIHPRKSFPLISFLFRAMFRAILVRWEIIYEQPLDKNKAYIFMPNHTTLWDVFAAGAFFPKYVVALEAHTHFKWFVYGWAIKAYGQIPINRKNPKASWRAYLEAIERLKQGDWVIVFPEGTRSKTGKLQRFKKIPFKFAKEAGVDLVPVGFVNLQKLSPADNKWIQPTKIKIHFGKPIPAQQIKQMSIEQLMELTYNEIKRLSEQD